ncbi:MAG: iron complex outermembrane receptor protein [Gammaproteobacteria bacterium]|jgi:iron complex outermembrane receptor protein
MRKFLRQSAIAAISSLFICSVHAADEGEPLVIIITPSGIEQPRNKANTTITVIDQKTIENSNANSVSELLRGQAGLHVSDFFGDGGQATIDLRGFGPAASRNTLVLLDGRRLNNSADSGSPDLSLIDVDEIAQIEILQGSSGVIYGNQAVGGVINIIRKKAVEDKINASIRVGSFGSSQLNASINKVLGRNRISASVSDRSSDNYRDNNESENQRLSVRAERIHRGQTTYIEVESVKDDIQTPGALLEDERDDDRSQSLSFYSGDFFETETQMIRLGMEKIIDDSRTISVDFSTRETDREFIQTFRPFPGSLTTQDRENQNLSASYKVVPVDAQPLTSYLIGFDHEDTDYELVSAFGPQAIDQTIQGLFISTQWSIGDQSQLDAGIRYSDQQAEIAGDDFDDSVSVFNIGFSQQINQLKLFARADQNFRYATVEEHTNVPFGDEPGLKTQEGLSVELGAELQKGAHRYRGTLYQIALDNEIAFDSSGFSNLNLDKTERTGIILEMANRWSERFSSRISLTSLDAEITDGSFKGNNLPLVPEQTIRLDGSYQYNPATLISVEVVTVDEQTFGGDFANQLDQLPGYQVVNTHISYHQKNWSIGFRINNLFDEEYAETGSQFTEFPAPTFAPVNYESYFPAPERNAWVNLKIMF